MKKTIISFLFLLVCGMAHSQVLAKGPEESYNADSIRAILDKSPYFTLFKDNYFIGGIPIGNKPTARNSDVKFQLSIAQRLTKSKLPSIPIFSCNTRKRLFGMSFKSPCRCAT